MPGKKLKTAVYIMNVGELSDEKLFSLAYNSVFDERKRKTDKYRFEKDKRLSLGGGLLLKYALSKAGYNICSPEFAYGENEKPYLKDSDIYFSISHSEDYAICAVSDAEIGCDIEKIKDVDLKIAEKFFTPSEYESILKEPDENGRQDMFFRCWTLKESFMKATGLGMSLSLSDFEIVPQKNISVIQSVDSRKYYFTEYTQINGYKCSLCVADKDIKPDFITVGVKELLFGGDKE